MDPASRATAIRRRRFTLITVAPLLGAVYAGNLPCHSALSTNQRAFRLSALKPTLIYAAYVIGNLVALCAFGRLTDQIGRRSASFPALAVAVFSTVLFLLVGDTPSLFAACITSGLAIGVGAATAIAKIAELYLAQNKAAAGRLPAINLAGLALGALACGLPANPRKSGSAK